MAVQRRERSMLFLLVAFFLACGMPTMVAANPVVVTVDPDWRYKIGDNPEWRRPDFDDAGWQRVEAGVDATDFSALGSTHTVWFRTRLPQPDESGAALFLGRVNDSDETFLDGVRIGGEGTIAGRARDYAGSGSGVVSRVYPLPGRMREGAVLAVRAQSFQFAPGPVSDLISIGDPVTLSRRARRADLAVWLRDALWLTVLFIAASVSLVSVRGAGQDARNFWLPWALGTTALAALPYTIVGYEFGLATPVLVWMAELSPFVLLWFVHLARAANETLTATQIGLIALYYAAMIGAVALNVGADAFKMLFHLSAAPLLIAGGISAGQVWRAWRRRRASFWTPLAVAAILGGMVVSLSLGAAIPAAFDPVNLGALAAVACLLLAMADDHRRDRAKLQRKTAELLIAQDAERARIAADLHDGVNQRLAVTRFRLERLGDRAQIDPKALIAPVEELRDAGRDIATMVEGLRLAPVAESFSEILGRSADRWSVLGDMVISVDIKGESAPDPWTQVQLFRIFQEAIHNAQRHGGARRIRVSAALSGQRGRLVIQDDGAGFDPDLAAGGLGLDGMAERARSAGATLTIDSAPGAGTRIGLEFPLT